MKYSLTAHAKKRIAERAIPKGLVEDALRNPTKMFYDNRGQLLIKKLYQKQGKERLLLIVGEKIEDQLKIITLIDTLKVKKYL